MSYIQDNLMSEESVICVGHPSWLSTLFPLFFLILAVVLRFTAPMLSYLSDILILTFLVYLLFAMLIIQVTEYAITNKRVLAKKGLFSISTSGIVLNKVESVELYQSFLGRFLNYGTVIVSGVGGSKEIFPHIQSPEYFRNSLQEVIYNTQSSPSKPSPESLQ